MDRDDQRIAQLMEAVREVTEIAEAERAQVELLRSNPPAVFDEEAVQQHALDLMARFRKLADAAARSKQVFLEPLQDDSPKVVHVVGQLAPLLDLVFKDAAAAIQQQATLIATPAGRVH
jgi:hypothetical protein